MPTARKIIHVDMDAFYASVEQRDDPDLKGLPVIVGGPAHSRSVVAAASYEARKFGIRSAMPTIQAVRLCPAAVIVKPRFDAYRAVSQQIMQIFRRYSDLVEPLSLDEAYVDVTENKQNNPSATRIAQEILSAIKLETELTASAGVAPNKFLAKIASAMRKPDSLTVITPERVAEVLETLPIRKVPGIGRKTEEKMMHLGILTAKDLRSWEEDKLVEAFGKSGSWYYRVARGEDEREVRAHRERKSVGAEDTFSEDLLAYDDLVAELRKIIERVYRRLGQRLGRTVTLKVTYSDFKRITRGITPEAAPNSEEEFLQIVLELLNQTEATKRPIRLLGVSVSNFNGPAIKERGDERQLVFNFG